MIYFVFPTETLQAWLLSCNKRIWVQRLVGECLVDITLTTDGQRQLFWTWPC